MASNIKDLPSRVIAGHRYYLWDQHMTQKAASQHAVAVKESFKGSRAARIPEEIPHVHGHVWGTWVRR
jgi:hypothetical protein